MEKIPSSNAAIAGCFGRRADGLSRRHVRHVCSRRGRGFRRCPRSSTPGDARAEARSRPEGRDEAQIEAKTDAKRAKAETWLAWLKDEVETPAARSRPCARSSTTLGSIDASKLEKEYPDLYAVAIQLAPTPGADQPTLADQLDDTPADKACAEIVDEINAANANIDVNSIVSRHKADIEAMPDDLQIKIEVAASQRKTAIQTEREGAGAK
jgi:hypothetical protein